LIIFLVSWGCRWLYFSGFLHVLYASAGASADGKEKNIVRASSPIIQ